VEDMINAAQGDEGFGAHQAVCVRNNANAHDEQALETDAQAGARIEVVA
jgi:hypothetical protein